MAMTKLPPLNTQHLLKHIKDYMFIVLGLTSYAFGFCAFVLPEKVVTGGVTGITSLLNFGLGWNVAITFYAVNLLLLAIAFRSVGTQFVIRTVFGATVASMMIGLFTPLTHSPIVQHEPFMNMIIGACFCGVGVGTVFVHNGSSAGTDIIAAMVTKHTTISFGRMLLYMDLVIISSSYVLFHSIDKIVYGLIFMIINSFVADLVINSNRQAVQFLIFSKKWEDIANAINNEAHRGCTLIHGTGWYTKRDVKILLVMCRKHESVHVMRIIKAMDNDALISQAYVNAIYGQGFDEMKVHLHKFKPQERDESMAANVDLNKESASRDDNN